METFEKRVVENPEVEGETMEVLVKIETTETVTSISELEGKKQRLADHRDLFANKKNDEIAAIDELISKASAV